MEIDIRPPKRNAPAVNALSDDGWTAGLRDREKGRRKKRLSRHDDGMRNELARDRDQQLPTHTIGTGQRLANRTGVGMMIVIVTRVVGISERLIGFRR